MPKKASAPTGAAARPGVPIPVRLQEDEEFRPLAVSLEEKEVELKGLAGLNRVYPVDWE